MLPSFSILIIPTAEAGPANRNQILNGTLLPGPAMENKNLNRMLLPPFCILIEFLPSKLVMQTGNAKACKSALKIDSRLVDTCSDWVENLGSASI
jgi:hypothetical protein